VVGARQLTQDERVGPVRLAARHAEPRTPPRPGWIAVSVATGTAFTVRSRILALVRIQPCQRDLEASLRPRLARAPDDYASNDPEAGHHCVRYSTCAAGSCPLIVGGEYRIYDGEL
jgi:hypothetical protein